MSDLKDATQQQPPQDGNNNNAASTAAAAAAPQQVPKGQLILSEMIDSLVKHNLECVFGGGGGSGSGSGSGEPRWDQLSHDEIKRRGSEIVDRVMSELRPIAGYKFVVSCTCMPKNGAGLHSAASCYWDNQSDGGTAIRWENRYVTCVVHVFVLAN